MYFIINLCFPLVLGHCKTEVLLLGQLSIKQAANASHLSRPATDAQLWAPPPHNRALQSVQQRRPSSARENELLHWPPESPGTSPGSVELGLVEVARSQTAIRCESFCRLDAGGKRIKNIPSILNNIYFCLHQKGKLVGAQFLVWLFCVLTIV